MLNNSTTYYYVQFWEEICINTAWHLAAWLIELRVMAEWDFK